MTIIEFAFILPAMLTLICGSVELGHMLFARVVLEGAVTEAARLATASLETGESQRTTRMRDSIIAQMGSFPLASGKTVTITTRVYRDFSSAYPEVYTDSNGNGRYDVNEPYVDRNANGRWDNTTQVSGSTLGGPGDVVSYTAIFPKSILFGFLTNELGFTGNAITLSATTVVRNEAVVRRAT